MNKFIETTEDLIELIELIENTKFKEITIEKMVNSEIRYFEKFNVENDILPIKSFYDFFLNWYENNQYKDCASYTINDNKLIQITMNSFNNGNNAIMFFC